MRRQITFISLTLFLMGFTSCNTYYYSTIETNQQEVAKQENGDFVQENDSVTITYCFYGENLPIEITIYNKLDKPLFLDWQQSALIVDDAANSYFSRNIPVRGETHSTTYTYRDFLFPHTNYSETFSNFAGQATLPEGMAFIPPKSMINSTPITLENFAFENIPNEAYTKTKFAGSVDGTKTVKVMNFTEKNSPLRFRSYLTLYTIAENGTRDKPMVFEQRFYISHLMKGGSMAPQNLMANQQQRGDFFYIRQEKGTGVGVIAGVVAIGVASIAIEAAVAPRRY